MIDNKKKEGRKIYYFCPECGRVSERKELCKNCDSIMIKKEIPVREGVVTK
jgi:hypothetical protein